MKKCILFSTLLVGMLFALPVYAQGTIESVANFDANITINKDASAVVTETITYDFGTDQKHGIYRTIPVSYPTDIGNTSIKLTNVSVVDEAGQAYPFSVSSSGRNKVIKIGDPNVLVTGKKTYVVTYTVARAIGYFFDYDELYWNVTGNEWQVPIQKASAEFTLPAAVARETIRAACYQGAFGSITKCNAPVLGAPGEASTSVQHVSFTSGLLATNEGLTATVGFPKGVVFEPSELQKILGVITDNWVVGLPLLVLLGMFVQWYRNGRDPQGRGTIIAEYEAPDALTPIEMSALQYATVKNSALSGEIIYLATQGYLTITRIETKGMLFTSHDYVLKRLKPSLGLPEFDQLLLDGMFATNEIKLSDLKEKFYAKLPDIKKAVMQSVLSKKYYAADPQKVTGLYIAAGIGIGLLVWFLGSLTDPGMLSVGSGIASAVIVVLFAFIMPKVTQAGAIAKEKAQGLKLYLTVAEKDRIEFHNAPEKNPKLFETLLPFAMVLGVEAAWAKQFEGIYLPPPGWYNDPGMRGFNAVLFVNNLQSFNTSARATLTSAPQGASGSGGGGFSGGGGGGGGGGSW